MKVHLNASRAPEVDRRALERSARTILGALGSTDAELSVTLVDDLEITRLAGEYGRRPRATDVLSFALAEGPGAEFAGGVLGDVVISLDTAKRQAAARGVPIAIELDDLLIHGCLHLLGMDHLRAADRARMRALEAHLRWELRRLA
ncbi:MAG: rRNA maturation RNase YbeY [Deltaproteobacteria bacterium]|nr:rRNA maturation RNase YbeY [Deltaproteobacteria bacterium]